MTVNKTNLKQNSNITAKNMTFYNHQRQPSVRPLL